MARNKNVPFGYFNHTSWRPQADPPFPLIALHPREWDKNQFSISTGMKPVWVDFVVNNLDEGPHPFHLVRKIQNQYILPSVSFQNKLNGGRRPRLDSCLTNFRNMNLRSVSSMAILSSSYRSLNPLSVGAHTTPSSPHRSQLRLSPITCLRLC
jgi:hypothetical protein